MEKKLSLGRKLLFSMGSFGVNLIGVTLTSWLLFFYSPPADSGRTVYLSATIVGILLTIASIWDSIIDPFIGQFSDNTRSKWGRRKPFLLIGAPIEVVALILLFIPPARSSAVLVGAYLFILRLIFFTSHSLVCIPYDGLIAEMTKKPEERVGLASFKNFFGLLGTLVGSLCAGILFEVSPIAMTAIIGLIGLAAIYATVPSILESNQVIADPMPVFKGIKLALKNKPFVILSITAIAYMLAEGIILANNAYIVTLVVGGSEGDAGLFTAVMIVVMMVFAVIWNLVAKKASPGKLYSICLYVLAISGLFAFFTGMAPFIPANIHYIISLALIAPSLGGALIFSFGLMGAVVDYDEKLTNQRREALFYGVFSLASGIGMSVSTLILPLAYNTFGYTKADPDGPRVAFLIIFLIMIAAALVFRKYKLSDTGEPVN